MAPVDDLLRRWLVDDPLSRGMLGSLTPQPVRMHLEPRHHTLSVAFYDGASTTLAPVPRESNAPRPRLAVGCTCDASTKGTCKHQVGAVRFLLARLSDKGEPLPWVGAWTEVLVPASPATARERIDALVHTMKASHAKGVLVEWLVRWPSDEKGLPRVSARARAMRRSGGYGVAKAIPEPALPATLAASHERRDRRIAEHLTLDAVAHPDARSRTAVLTALLPLLVGHPRVRLDEEDEPLAVEALSPRMALIDEGGTFLLRIESHGLSIGAGSAAAGGGPRLVALLDRPRHRIIVGHAPPELVLAIDAAARERPFPREYAPVVLEALASGPLPLEVPPSLAPAATPCDGRLRVAFSQVAGAWSLALVVRPFGTGLRFPPGQGPTHPVAALHGVWRSTSRDLDVEVARAESLAEDLGLALEAPEWNASLDLAETLALAERLVGVEGVLVEWPQNPPRLLSGAAQLRVSLASRTGWFDVDGTAEIDGTSMPIATLLAARRAGQRFVEVEAGKFVDLARSFDERLERLAAATREEKGRQRLSRGAAFDAHALFTDFDALEGTRGWLDLAKKSATLSTLTIDVPETLAATLRDYQLEGYLWLARLAELGLGAVLADDMGLGKTVQGIAMLLRRADLGPALVVAPTSVVFNWQRELARFAPSLDVVVYGDGDRTRALEAASNTTVLLVTWALLRRDGEAIAARRWNTVVLDEAHAMKNAKTATAKAARSLASDWTVALTGTPIENHLGELHSLMECVLPGLFGSWEQFSRSFAAPIEGRRDAAAQARLARLTRPFLLRRTKAQVAASLPPRTEVRLDVQLSPGERALYNAECARALGLVSKESVPGDARLHVLAALMRARQLACAAHLVDERQPKVSSKLTTLLEEVREVHAEGRAMLIFSQFTSLLALVGEALSAEALPHASLTGETPRDERRRLVDAFQAGHFRIFLLSLKAGGAGLNLTAADTVFLLDPWWNPAAEDQAADRAHRLGQTQPVTIVRLVTLGTVEEKVLALHAKKRDLVHGVLDGAEVGAKVSVAELVELLRG